MLLKIQSVSKMTCGICQTATFNLVICDMSDDHNFWNDERCEVIVIYSLAYLIVSLTETSFKMAPTILSVVNMVNNFLPKNYKFCVVQIIHFCSNFYQLMVKIFIKELQIVFMTSSVSNSNGDRGELECKILYIN